MKIDLDLDFDVLRIYFRLEQYILGCVLDDPDDYGDAFCLELDFTITNRTWECDQRRAFGYIFHNEYQTITISIWDKEYVFRIPPYLFVSKTQEYVDHFNWVKEAYVS
jgi:hypothetical protein